MQKVLKGTLCARDQDGLFAGLYIIWIISQKQQQLCLILFYRTE